MRGKCVSCKMKRRNAPPLSSGVKSDFGNWKQTFCQKEMMSFIDPTQLHSRSVAAHHTLHSLRTACDMYQVFFDLLKTSNPFPFNSSPLNFSSSRSIVLRVKTEETGEDICLTSFLFFLKFCFTSGM